MPAIINVSRRQRGRLNVSPRPLSLSPYRSLPLQTQGKPSHKPSLSIPPFHDKIVLPTPALYSMQTGPNRSHVIASTRLSGPFLQAGWVFYRSFGLERGQGTRQGLKRNILGEFHSSHILPPLPVHAHHLLSPGTFGGGVLHLGDAVLTKYV